MGVDWLKLNVVSLFFSLDNGSKFAEKNVCVSS
jgi:hypothetical protein